MRSINRRPHVRSHVRANATARLVTAITVVWFTIVGLPAPTASAREVQVAAQGVVVQGVAALPERRCAPAGIPAFGRPYAEQLCRRLRKRILNYVGGRLGYLPHRPHHTAPVTRAHHPAIRHHASPSGPGPTHAGHRTGSGYSTVHAAGTRRPPASHHTTDGRGISTAQNAAPGHHGPGNPSHGRPAAAGRRGGQPRPASGSRSTIPASAGRPAGLRAAHVVPGQVVAPSPGKRAAVSPGGARSDSQVGVSKVVLMVLLTLGGVLGWRRTRRLRPALTSGLVAAFGAVPRGRAVRRLPAPAPPAGELPAPAPVRACVHETGTEELPRLAADGCLTLGMPASGAGHDGSDPAVTVNPAEAGGLTLSGPGADHVARAILIGLATQARGWELQVVIPRPDLARLLGLDASQLPCGQVPGLIVTSTLAEALFHLRVETMRGHQTIEDRLDVTESAARGRGMASEQAVGDRPRLLLIAAPDEDSRCPRATLQNYGAGIGVILLGSWPHAATVHIDTSGNVTTATGPSGGHLTEARLFGLTTAETRTHLTQWAALTEPSETAVSIPCATPQPSSTPTAPTSSPEPVSAPEVQAVPWMPRARLHIRLLGPTVVEVDGHETPARMGRQDGWSLLAILAVFRDGITDDTITEYLWPHLDGNRQRQHLDGAVKALNKALREATGVGRDVRFAIKTQRRRLLHHGLVDTDLWRIQDALSAATVTGTDRPQALRQAIELAAGPLLYADDHAWPHAYRIDLSNQLTDAASRLAAAEAETDPDLALHHLSQIVDHVDPTAEDLYRQMMRIHARLDRPEAAERTFQQLSRRLAEQGGHPSQQTIQLYGDIATNR